MADRNILALHDRIDEEHFETHLLKQAVRALQERVILLESEVRELRREAFERKRPPSPTPSARDIYRRLDAQNAYPCSFVVLQKIAIIAGYLNDQALTVKCASFSHSLRERLSVIEHRI